MTDFMTVVVLLAFSNALPNKLMIMASQTILGIIWPKSKVIVVYELMTSCM